MEKLPVTEMILAALALLGTLTLAAVPVAAGTLGYDALNRLKTVSYGNGSSISYSYDAAGNITAVASVSDSAPPVVISGAPATGATGVPLGAAISVTFSEPITGTSALNAISVTGPGGAVSGQVSVDYATITFTPDVALALLASYTVRVSGAADFANNVQTAPSQWSFTTVAKAEAQLTVVTAGSGSGSVTSIPEGINCLSGVPAGCRASFPAGTLVTLDPAPAWYSGTVWSGCSVEGDNCTVTLSTDQEVTARFETAPNAKLLTVIPGYYGRIADAYAAASSSQTILARDSAFVIFSENLVFAKPLSMVLAGGNDAAWSSLGHSTIKGSLRIRNGRLTIRGIVLY